MFIQLNQQPNGEPQENNGDDEQRAQIGFHNSIPFLFFIIADRWCYVNGTIMSFFVFLL